MTSHAVGRTARLLGEQTWLVIALLVPVVHLTGGGTDTAALLVVCVAALVAATTPALVPALSRVAAPSPGRTAPPAAPPSSRIPDPVHHPVSPRAPGLV